MIKNIFSFFILLFIGVNSYAQNNYSLKVEAGYLKYLYNVVSVDPGPGWKGYNLEESNGIAVNITNGIKIKNKKFVGLGLGYLNFEGKNGLSIYLDYDYVPFKTRLSLLLNIKLGYSHLWNQYENGTSAFLRELGIGLNYKLTEDKDIYVKSGFLMTQQSLLVPVRVGLRF